MPKPIEILPAAKREADEAYEWYARRDLRAAQGFSRTFDLAVERIANLPQSFAPYLLGTRRCVLRGYPYLIVFEEQLDRITVLAVAHGRRRPAYWGDRLS